MINYQGRPKEVICVKEINCPECDSRKVAKNGKSKKGEQRYICKDDTCTGKSFKLEYTYNGWEVGIGEQIISLRTHDLGIREIARELGVSKQKVQETLKELQHQIDCLCKGCQ